MVPSTCPVNVVLSRVAGGNCRRRPFENFSQTSPGVPEASLRVAVPESCITLLLKEFRKMKTEWAFLAGLGVGTVATLMLALQSGQETQELLAGKLRGRLDQVASAGKRVRAQVKDLTNRGKEKVAEAIDTGTEACRTSVSGG
jgi:gas vesicle protein